MTYTASSWTLDNIIQKTRNITGTPSQDQLLDSEIVDYINKYYSFVMPFELKEQITLEKLMFKTNPGQDTYSFPGVGGAFLTDQPMAYADGYPLIFYQDADVFYQDWPIQYAVDSIGTGDGSTLLFTGGLQNPPVIIGSAFITDGVTVFQDNGDGTWSENYPISTQPTPEINASVGTLNYTTGAYSVSFTNAPASSATIYAKYLGYQGDRPQGILFFQNQFVVRPVPDQVYQIQMQGYIQPTQLLEGSDLAIQPELGPLIAYGAAMQIFEDRGDKAKTDEAYEFLKRYENVALARTVQQFQGEQSIPRF